MTVSALKLSIYLQNLHTKYNSLKGQWWRVLSFDVFFCSLVLILNSQCLIFSQEKNGTYNWQKLKLKLQLEVWNLKFKAEMMVSVAFWLSFVDQNYAPPFDLLFPVYKCINKRPQLYLLLLPERTNEISDRERDAVRGLRRIWQ